MIKYCVYVHAFVYVYVCVCVSMCMYVCVCPLFCDIIHNHEKKFLNLAYYSTCYTKKGHKMSTSYLMKNKYKLLV